jgi:hypothetical protein
MHGVGSIVPVPDGEHVKPHVLVGSVQLSGEALANPQGEGLHILVVVGGLVITSPVEKVGYDQIVVVGHVLAPEGSEGALGGGITNLQGAIHYYPAGAKVKVHDGVVKLSGKALANPAGKPNDILIVAGQLIITSPVESLGYSLIVVSGQVFAPRASEDLLGPMLQVNGQVMWYGGVPRFFSGDERFAAAFFELLPEPVTLLLNGSVVIEDDVTVELLRSKVSEIVLNGVLQAPKQLVPILQVLATEKNGEITAVEPSSGDGA